MKKIGSFIIILSVLGFLMSVAKFNNLSVNAQSGCTQLTSSNSAVLKGRITDTGGDPNLTVWFLWRRQGSSLWTQTPQQSVYASNLPYEFSFNLTGLQACTTYEYKAIARNSAGTSEGSIICFRTACQINLSCSVSPNPARIGETVTFSASVSGGVPPYSYSWSGACTSFSSSCVTSFNSSGTYTANLKITDSMGNTQNTSCTLNVTARLPQVITLPPVETF